MKKPGSGRRTALIVLCAVLEVVLVLLIAATAYMENLLGLINRKEPGQEYMSHEEYQKGETNDPTYTGPTMDPGKVQWGQAETIGAGKDIVNLLLIGQDRRPGESRARSDSMILCTINKKTKTVTLVSFMRDLYVQIPEHSDNRINASYAMGGMDLLDACLKQNFGIEIDGNIEVDFFGFEDAINILGGLDIELTAKEAQYLNRWGNWDVYDNAWEWSLTQGVNSMNGSQVVAYSRIRDVGNGDFGRTNRQRIVLTKLMEKAKGMSITQANQLLHELLPLITTDLTDAQIVNFAVELIPLLPGLTINTQQIPAEGAYKMTMINGMSVLLPDIEKNRQILSDILK